MHANVQTFGGAGHFVQDVRVDFWPVGRENIQVNVGPEDITSLRKWVAVVNWDHGMRSEYIVFKDMCGTYRIYMIALKNGQSQRVSTRREFVGYAPNLKWANRTIATHAQARFSVSGWHRYQNRNGTVKAEKPTLAM